MSNSPAVQAARKTVQETRLAQKTQPGYSEYYATMPAQVERTKLHATHNAALGSLEIAEEALEIALITGVNLEAAKEAYAIAALVAERTKPAPRGAHLAVQLTGA